MDQEQKIKRCIESRALINAIENEDVSCCADLLESYPSKRLNKLHRVQLVTGECTTFTFLLLAVAVGNPEIVEKFLKRKVSVDRKGHSEQGYVSYTYTPLLRAIKQHNVAVVELLLRYGADPYAEISSPKYAEEEGRAYRYNSIIYPVEIAIKTRNSDIIESVLRSCDPATLYGAKKHTCLCFALLELCSVEADPTSLSVLSQVMDLGGRLCSGNIEDVGNAFRHSGCVYVNYLVHTALCEASTDMFTFHLLQHVCRSDYVRDTSTLYKALRKYNAYSVERLFDGLVKEGQMSAAQTNNVDDNMAKILTWFIEYTRRPSSLKDICRIVIRNSCRPWRKEKCQELPLPTVLQNFL